MSDSLFLRSLTKSEIYWFYLLAVFCFVFPLISAQYLFLDDIDRTLEAQGAWVREGRFLIQWFYRFIAFNQHVPNIFPLSLILAVVVLAFALRRWVLWCFEKPGLSQCLVILPLVYTPFFLQNLSYQFDGPVMVAGLAVIIYSVVGERSTVYKTVLTSVVLLIFALAIYQVLINLYVVLCCFEIIKGVEDKKSTAKVLSRLALRVGCLVAGVGVYYLITNGFMSGERQGLLPLDGDWGFEVLARLTKIFADISGDFPAAIQLMVLVVVALALLGYLRSGGYILRSAEPLRMKLMLGLVYLACVPVMVFFISGVMLFFESFNDGFRTLIGLSGVLVVVFYLAHRVLSRFCGWSCFIVALPLFYCVSVSYAYGRVLMYQKVLETNVLANLSQDVQHSEFKTLQRINFISAASVATLPAAEGIYQAMPVLRALDVGYVVVVHMLPSVGLVNVYANQDKTIEALIRAGSFPPFLVTNYYNFYMINGDGYIVMNDTKRE